MAAEPDSMQSIYHKQNDNERITPASLNRIGALGARALYGALANLLVKKSDGEHLDQGDVAYVGDGCKVIPVSGDRETGFTLRVQAGFGILRATGANADIEAHSVDVFVPVVVQAPFTFVTTASHALNPRIDAVYLKRVVADANSQDVDIIDPVTKVITNEARNIDTRVATTFSNGGFAYVVGTAAGSPTPPATPVGFLERDLIALITVAPGSGLIDVADIDDSREVFELHPTAAAGLGAISAGDISVDAPLPDADVQEALERHDAEIDTLAAAAVRGLCYHGGLVYTDTATVTLRRGAGRGGVDAEIAIEIDGAVVTKTDADLAFSIVTHIEGTEAASTWYYLYVSESSGAIVPHVSATAPVMPGAGSGKVGYHPTQTAWRFLGSVDPTIGVFFNDASSNIVPFVANTEGWQWRDLTPATHIDFPMAAPAGANWQAVDLSTLLPAIAREALVQVSLQGDDCSVDFAGGSRIGNAIGSTTGVIHLSVHTVTTGSIADLQGFVALDSSRRIAYGLTTAGTIVSLYMGVVGWR